MPGLDRTGKTGLGSRTGRQMGKCRKPGDNEFTDESLIGREMVPGRGMGRGAGLAAGRAHRRGTGRGPGRGQGRRFGQA